MSEFASKSWLHKIADKKKKYEVVVINSMFITVVFCFLLHFFTVITVIIL